MEFKTSVIQNIHACTLICHSVVHTQVQLHVSSHYSINH